MAANMVRNLGKALHGLPIRSITVWMNSMVALYWITNPDKTWKTFVYNRAQKISEITEENKVKWRYCPSEKNVADLRSRGASLEKLEEGNWFEGPSWLLDEENWPEQPTLKSSKKSSEEAKPMKEIVAFSKENEVLTDEWDSLLERRSYWTTLRVTAWVLRFANNCKAKVKKTKKTSGPLVTEEIQKAREYSILRAQKNIKENLESPGWKLERGLKTGILKCVGRVQEYHRIYLENGTFAQKLIQYEH